MFSALDAVFVSAGVPSWLEKILVDAALKLLTPELVAKAEEAAKVFVIGELKKLAAATTMTDIDDLVIAKLAVILGVPG